MVYSPAGMTTISGHSRQSRKALIAPGTFQISGGAARRCSGVSALRRAKAALASASVLALRSAIAASEGGSLLVCCACVTIENIAPVATIKTMSNAGIDTRLWTRISLNLSEGYCHGSGTRLIYSLRYNEWQTSQVISSA